MAHAGSGGLRPPVIDRNAYPLQNVEVHDTKDVCIAVFKREVFHSPAGPGKFKQGNKHPDAVKTNAGNAVIVARTTFEFLLKMIQDGYVGTCEERETKEHEKWRVKYGHLTHDGMPPTPPDSEAASAMEDLESTTSSANARKRPRIIPSEPTQVMEKVPSLTFVEKETGLVKPKVRVFLKLLVKNRETDLLDLHSYRNVVGYALVLIALDPLYTFTAAAERMAMVMQERIKEFYSNHRKGKRANYVSDVRQIFYFTKDEAKIAGYDKVISDSAYKSCLATPYARSAKVDVPTAPFGIDCFSLDAFVHLATEMGVCEDQLLMGPQVGGDPTTFLFTVPECTAELTIEQADPKDLFNRQWPWFAETEKFVLTQPFDSFDVSTIGNHKANKVQEAMTDTMELQRHGLIDNTPKTASPFKTPTPFELAEERHRDALNSVMERRTSYTRAFNALFGACAADLNEPIINRIQDEADAAIGPHTTSFTYMADLLSRLVEHAPGTHTQALVELSVLIRNVDREHTRLMRVIEEDVLTWMHAGNPDLPETCQAVLDWADAHDNTFAEHAPCMTNELSQFGNFVYGIIVLISAGFQVSGMVGPIMHTLLASFDGMDDSDNLKSNMFMYGEAGSGKSMVYEILEELLPVGATSRETGGGSAREAYFSNEANRTRIAHEAPVHLVAKRNSRNPEMHRKMTSALEAMTSKRLAYHMTESSDHPTIPGKKTFQSVVQNARSTNLTLIASNDYPWDKAVRSRFVMLEIHRAAYTDANSLLVRAMVNKTEANLVKRHACNLVGAYYFLNMYIRKFITAGRLPMPSSYLFDMQLVRGMRVLELNGVEDTNDFRGMGKIRQIYWNAIMYDAITKAFMSPLSARREHIRKPDGSVSLGPLRFTPDMIPDVLKFFVDNEEIAAYVLNLRFNELVSKYRHNIYRRLFAGMLKSGAFDEDQLAAWVRYVSYDALVSNGANERHTPERPSFAEYGPADLRSLYAYGSKLEQDGVGVKDPFVKMARPPVGLAEYLEEHSEDMSSPGNWTPSSRPGPLESRHPSNLEQFGGPPATLPLSTLHETCHLRSGHREWRTIHPSLLGHVPLRPKSGGVAPSLDDFKQLPNDRLDLNYVKLGEDSLAKLAEQVVRESKYNPSAGGTGNEDSVLKVLQQLGDMTVHTHPLPSISRAQAEHNWGMERFAECFLPQNLEPYARPMKALLREARLVNDPKSKAEDIFINVALVGITYERLRKLFLGVFSHKYTRERIITLGPTQACTHAPMETYELKASDTVIRTRDPAFQGSALATEVLQTYVGNFRLERDKIDPSSSLAASLATIGSDARWLDITQDMEAQCSSDYRRLHNIPLGSLPVDCDRAITAFYSQRQDPASIRYFKFSYVDAVRKAQAQIDAERGQPAQSPFRDIGTPRRPAQNFPSAMEM